MMCRATLLLLVAVPSALGHGAMVHPRSRNSWDTFANVPAKDKQVCSVAAAGSLGCCCL